ncbi:MAG: hypothetical protein B7Z55_13025, partial [Planctomycetales bacterium 12-60-4]
MQRIILPVLLGLAIGLGMGWVQSKGLNQVFEERFSLSRSTDAEAKGEITQAEIIEKAVGTPRVEVPGGSSYVFGNMKLGESMSHEFPFRNAGDGPLVLTMGTSTCKCTIGDLEKSILEPGEQTMIKLTWTPKAPALDFSQSATIITNDPLKGEVQLSIAGKVGQSIVFSPSSLSLGDFSSTETSTHKIRVYSHLEGVTIESLVWSDPEGSKLVSFTKTEIDPRTDSENESAFKGYDVTVTIKPGMRLGPMNAKILATTNMQEKLDPIEVPVSGRVSGDTELIGGPSFDADKATLTIGKVSRKEETVVRLQLSIQGADRASAVPKVISVVPAESLEVEIGEPRESASRRLFPIVFKVPQGAPIATYPGSNPKNFGKVIIKPSE